MDYFSDEGFECIVFSLEWWVIVFVMYFVKIYNFLVFGKLFVCVIFINKDFFCVFW